MAKFLEFVLENQDYAISVNSVCNISQPNKIFRVPHTPDFVLGVTHYRGYILTVIDLAIVVTLIFYACKMLKNTRAWQLLKGIFILVLVTIISNMLRLKILNYILSIIMMYGGIMIIVIFQPEIRRGLEQLRSK